MKKILYILIALFSCNVASAQLLQSAPAKRNNASDTYYLQADSLLRAGFRVVADSVERNAIPTTGGIRKFGMAVLQQSDTCVYTLNNPVTSNNWKNWGKLGGYLQKNDTLSLLATQSYVNNLSGNASGYLVNSNMSTTDASKFSNSVTGSTFTFGTSGLTISGTSTGVYNDFIYWNDHKIMFSEWTSSATIQVNSIATGTGIGAGMQSTNPLYGPMAYLSNGKLNILISSSITGATSAKTLNYSVGDWVDISLTKHHRVMIATAVNRRNNDAVTVYYDLNNAYQSYQLQVTGYPAIMTGGGSYLVNKFSFRSNLKNNPKFVVIGDSITDWAFAGSDDQTYFNLVAGQILPGYEMEKFAIGGATFTDAINGVSDIQRLNPDFALINLGVNDFLSGNTVAQVSANLELLMSKLRQNKIKPIIITPNPFGNGLAANDSLKAFHDYLINNLSHDYLVIDTWSALVATGQTYINPVYNAGDGHPNAAGHEEMAHVILAALTSNQFPIGGKKYFDSKIVLNGGVDSYKPSDSNGSGFNAVSVTPSYSLNATSGATDEKITELVTLGAHTFLRFDNDARTAANNILDITRSSTSATNISFNANYAVFTGGLEAQNGIYNRGDYSYLSETGSSWSTAFARVISSDGIARLNALKFNNLQVFNEANYVSARTLSALDFDYKQARDSALLNYVTLSSANLPNGYLKLDGSGNASITGEYFGSSAEFGGTFPGSGAGGFYNNSPTGRATYLIGGALGYHNTDIYDYNNNLVAYILGTKTVTSADSLALVPKKYTDATYQAITAKNSANGYLGISSSALSTNAVVYNTSSGAATDVNFNYSNKQLAIGATSAGNFLSTTIPNGLRVTGTNTGGNGLMVEAANGGSAILLVKSTGLEAGQYFYAGSNTTGNRLFRFDLVNNKFEADILNDAGTAITSTPLSIDLSSQATTFSGLAKYATDLSSSYTSRSLIDKGYADSNYGRVTLASFNTNVQNTSTTETDLYSYSVPANTVAANGNQLKASYTLITLASGGNKYTRVYFAGTALNVNLTSAASTIKVDVSIMRSGASTAIATVSIAYDNASVRVTETDLSGLNFATANILKITGMADAGTGGEITAKSGSVRLE